MRILGNSRLWKYQASLDIQLKNPQGAQQISIRLKLGNSSLEGWEDNNQHRYYFIKNMNDLNNLELVDEDLKQVVIQQLKTVYDPEIPVNIFDLGLIYAVNIMNSTEVIIDMTLTNANCPVAETFPTEVRDKILGIGAVTKAKVNLVWEPAWTLDLVPESVKLDLGLI